MITRRRRGRLVHDRLSPLIRHVRSSGRPMTAPDAHGEAVSMTLTRLWARGGDRRAALVDAFEFPSSVRQRFTLKHGNLNADGIRTVEAATRQWFRLASRHPKANLSMPSVVVDDLWHEFVLHTREYAAFCETALGRFLHHVPESAMSPSGAAVNRSSGLLNTLQFAQQDERSDPQQLPLLFRVDQELAVDGGRRYLADCGGRGECFQAPGALCLKHLDGVGKRVRGDWGSGRAANPGSGASDVSGGNAGCAAGGGD
jgi:hypothetical protein